MKRNIVINIATVLLLTVTGVQNSLLAVDKLDIIKYDLESKQYDIQDYQTAILLHEAKINQLALAKAKAEIEYEAAPLEQIRLEKRTTLENISKEIALLLQKRDMAQQKLNSTKKDVIVLQKTIEEQENTTRGWWPFKKKPVATPETEIQLLKKELAKQSTIREAIELKKQLEFIKKQNIEDLAQQNLQNQEKPRKSWGFFRKKSEESAFQTPEVQLEVLKKKLAAAEKAQQVAETRAQAIEAAAQKAQQEQQQQQQQQHQTQPQTKEGTILKQQDRLPANADGTRQELKTEFIQSSPNQTSEESKIENVTNNPTGEDKPKNSNEKKIPYANDHGQNAKETPHPRLWNSITSFFKNAFLSTINFGDAHKMAIGGITGIAAGSLITYKVAMNNLNTLAEALTKSDDLNVPSLVDALPIAKYIRLFAKAECNAIEAALRQKNRTAALEAIVKAKMKFKKNLAFACLATTMSIGLLDAGHSYFKKPATNFN